MSGRKEPEVPQVPGFGRRLRAGEIVSSEATCAVAALIGLRCYVTLTVSDERFDAEMEALQNTPDELPPFVQACLLKDADTIGIRVEAADGSTGDVFYPWAQIRNIRPYGE